MSESKYKKVGTVTIRGVTYKNAKAAAEALKVDVSSVYRAVRQKRLDDLMNRPEGAPSRGRLATPVMIEGVTYRSAMSAAKALGKGRETIYKHARQQRLDASKKILPHTAAKASRTDMKSAILKLALTGMRPYQIASELGLRYNSVTSIMSKLRAAGKLVGQPPKGQSVRHASRRQNLKIGNMGEQFDKLSPELTAAMVKHAADKGYSSLSEFMIDMSVSAFVEETSQKTPGASI